MSPLLLANVVVGWLLVGLIWTVQVVHYPLFARVAGPAWQAYHHEHMRRITVLVAPLMVGEVLLLALLLIQVPQAGWAWVAGAALVGVWLSTWLLQVPAHTRQGRAGPAATEVHGTIRRLVVGNWLRTALWTGKALALTALLI